MATKPTIPKGTRDFSPIEMARRNFILDTIKTVYQRYGFQQIETPAMENLSTLEGKYGEEGDKLLFRVLNSGTLIEDFPISKSVVNDFVERKANQYQSDTFPAIELIRIRELQKHIAEKGLRYDLTVPFARYVVMHQNEITFPFKRFQMQQVWRADRPQKGRYREFMQCDADVIGSTSLLNEVELVQIIDDVFEKLGIGVTIKINNRKILSGIAEYYGIPPERFHEFVTILDKIDKIGLDFLFLEFNKAGFGDIDLTELISLFKLSPTDKFKMLELHFILEKLKKQFQIKNIEIGLKGIFELEQITKKFNRTNTDFWFDISDKNTLDIDLTLARGLNYYTGAIFEVKVNDTRSTFTSSVLGGGRYDDLTGIFGLPNVSGVGISFGIDRIYDVMEEMKLFDALNLQSASTQVLFVNFGGEEEKYCLKVLKEIREAGINAEIYPDAAAKMKKQMSYADAKKIPYVVLVGSEELKSGELTLKNMLSGEQEKINSDILLSKIKS